MIKNAFGYAGTRALDDDYLRYPICELSGKDA